MKRILLISLIFPISAYSQVFQKCIDDDGKITYADVCSVSKSAIIEQIYIADTYDAEADRQAQMNTLELEQRTQQSQYERYQRNARNKQVSMISPYNADRQVEAEKYFKQAEKVMKRMPYGSAGDRAKRESKIEQARVLENMGRAKLGLNTVPYTSNESRDYGKAKMPVIDVRTGTAFVDAAGGIINPRTGRFYPEVAGGYINTKTGKFIPKM